MNFQDCLFWTEKLIALAMIQQSAEQLSLNRQFLAPSRHFIFRKLVPHPTLTGARLLACLALIFTPHWAITAFLFLTNYLLLIRWRGNFNGGSDHMSMIILGGLAIAQAFPHSPIGTGAFLYIGIQSILSYFIAGWVKIKKSNWRQGHALRVFLLLSSYQKNVPVKKMTDSPKLLLAASWTGMLFELSAPLVLFFPGYLPVFIGIAICFHLLNFYLFGLNRFVFAWLASYPALTLSGLFVHQILF